MNGFSSNNQNEMEILKAQINQEEQLKQAVEQSYLELLSTSKELEKRMNMIDDESNEWKTRFENQEEINRQLTKQISMYEKKLDETRNRSKNIKNKYIIESNNEASPEHIKDFKNTKESLEGQLKDYAWRIEQENKAYHKANEERKEIHQELVDTRNQFIAEKKDKQAKSTFFSVPETSRKGVQSQMNYANENQLSNSKHHSSHSTQSVFLPSIYTSYDQYDSPGRKSELNSPKEQRRTNRDRDLSNRTVSKLHS